MSDDERLEKPLTAKQLAFAEAMADGLPPIAAAQRAGYADPNSSAYKCIADPRIRERILSIQPERDVAIAERAERQEFWTQVMRGEFQEQRVTKDGDIVDMDVPMSTRIQASRLLGMSKGDFIERKEVKLSGAVGFYLPDNGRANPTSPPVRELTEVEEDEDA